MKRALLLTVAAAAAVSLAACKKQSAEGPAGTTAPGQVLNRAQDAAGAAVGAASAALTGSHDTGAFVDNLVQGNSYEIEAAKIAEQKSRSPEVKGFARMMVSDHTALGVAAEPVIAKAGKTPPAQLDQRRQGLLDNLRAAGSREFDKTYIDQQVAAHKETLTLVTGYSQSGDDAGLKDLAAKAAPTVQAHLDKAQSLQGELTGGGPAGNPAAQ
jgi:putative membrane protein